MNIVTQRGIQSVHANTSHIEVNAAIKDMGEAFGEFREEYSEKHDAVKAELDQLQTIVARGEFGGGGSFSGDTDTAAARDHKKAFFSFVRKGVEDGLQTLEVNAKLTTLSDPDGGYGVPTIIDTQIEKLETDSAVMRRVARVKQITTSDYKKLVSVGGTSSGWVGEEEARGETNTPTLKQIAPTIGELYANPAVTQATLDDVGFDVAEWLVEEVASEFADKEGAAFITGNGVGKPKGILDYPTSTAVDASRTWGTLQYVASGGASIVADPDKLIDLVHSLRAKYRKGACWLMNSTTIATIRKLKDGDGNYIWRDGLEIGAPNSLLGYPVEEDENVPDVGAGNYPIMFGNFMRGYLILDRTGVRLLRDPLTNKPFVHFYTTKRTGAACINFEAIKLLKVAA